MKCSNLAYAAVLLSVIHRASFSHLAYEQEMNVRSIGPDSGQVGKNPDRRQQTSVRETPPSCALRGAKSVDAMYPMPEVAQTPMSSDQ